MARAQVDMAIQERILSLRKDGLSFNQISEMTGISKSTVRDVVKRGMGESTPKRVRPSNPPKKTKPQLVETPAPARDESDSISEDADSIRPSNPPVQSALDELTRERTAKELLSYIAVSKKGYIQATKNPRLEPDKKTWQEVQYLKLYKDGIKMLIDCTGLSREAIESLPTSPVDEWLTAALGNLEKRT